MHELINTRAGLHSVKPDSLRFRFCIFEKQSGRRAVLLRPLQLHGRGEEGDQVKGAMCVLLPWALRSLGGGRSHRSMLADGVRELIPEPPGIM